jgi:putative FmdB family regulatory protein
MPIYEYNCLDCSKTFEKIVWNTGDKEVFCPYCQGKNSIRVLSAFSKGSGGVKGVPTTSGCSPSPSGFS